MDYAIRNNRIHHLVKTRLNYFIAAQAFIGLGISLLAYGLFGRVFAYSALLGAMVFVVAALVFAKKMFAAAGACAARQVVNNLYQAELIKIIISAMLFAACFRYGHVNGAAFFISYGLLQMTVWLMPIFFK